MEVIHVKAEVRYATKPSSRVKSERKVISSAKYDSANTVGVYLKLNKKTDKDILDWFDSLTEPRQKYIKRLIRTDMEEVSNGEDN